MQISTPDDTRQLILDTAREHLSRFGLSKMTIVDVAKSLGMSHANVYRYFGSKREILDAIVDEWLARVEALLQPITRMPGAAAERIEGVAVEIYRRRRQKIESDAGMYESFLQIISLRPDAIARRIARIGAVFSQLLLEGIDTGEFTGIEPEAAASTLNDATALFLHPLVNVATMRETSEERLVKVIRSVLAGFRSPQQPAKGTARNGKRKISPRAPY